MSIERFLFGLTVTFLIFLSLVILYAIILIIALTYDYKKQKKKKDKAYYRVTLALIVTGIICIILFTALLSGIV